MQEFSVVICAAGRSTRFGSGTKKEYLPLNYFSKKIADRTNTNSITVLSESVCKFFFIEKAKNVVVVIPSTDFNTVQKILQNDPRLKNLKFSKFLQNEPAHVIAESINSERLLFLTAGGESRQSSVFNGLNALLKLKTCCKKMPVLIHDAARPFVSSSLIQKVLEALQNNDAAIPGIPVVDTQKIVDNEKCIKINLPRKDLRAVQTPQGFKLKEIYAAHFSADKNTNYTDDSEIFMSKFPNKKIKIVEGELSNKKITYAEDMLPQPENQLKKTPIEMRIGLGYDIHRLVKGKSLFLGGIKIKSELGFLAHSDGDVLLHSLTDALLGAVGFSDIGELFPPSDNQWKGADSKFLLKKAWVMCNKKQTYKIQNIDCVIITESPKLLPYRNKIRKSIAELLGINSSRVFVKAKTREGLDSVGQGKAVEAFTTVLLTQAPHPIS